MSDTVLLDSTPLTKAPGEVKELHGGRLSRALRMSITAYSPRQPEHGGAERLSLQGNPALRDDWAKAPDGPVVGFLTFVRTEGRSAPRFGADGSADDEVELTRQDRLEQWRSLQELAGRR